MPSQIPTLDEQTIQYFWSNVLIKPNGCWIWAGGKNRDGYGRFSISSRYYLAHRVSWFLKYGGIPEGKFVLHNCPMKDDPACVNPSHLYLGTDAENGLDRMIKCQLPIGENHPNAKLTPVQVVFIRCHPDLTANHLASMCRVSKSLVNAVRSRLIWKHVL